MSETRREKVARQLVAAPRSDAGKWVDEFKKHWNAKTKKYEPRVLDEDDNSPAAHEGRDWAADDEGYKGPDLTKPNQWADKGTFYFGIPHPDHPFETRDLSVYQKGGFRIHPETTKLSLPKWEADEDTTDYAYDVEPDSTNYAHEGHGQFGGTALKIIEKQGIPLQKLYPNPKDAVEAFSHSMSGRLKRK